MLAVQAEKQLGKFLVNVSFTSDTAATALFGPSGAGKTSVINMIAGLSKPERGRIVLGVSVLFGSSFVATPHPSYALRPEISRPAARFFKRGTRSVIRASSFSVRARQPRSSG